MRWRCARGGDGGDGAVDGGVDGGGVGPQVQELVDPQAAPQHHTQEQRLAGAGARGMPVMGVIAMMGVMAVGMKA
jgi:hypothetical protein